MENNTEKLVEIIKDNLRFQIQERWGKSKEYTYLGLKNCRTVKQWEGAGFQIKEKETPLIYERTIKIKSLHTDKVFSLLCIREMFCSWQVTFIGKPKK